MDIKGAKSAINKTKVRKMKRNKAKTIEECFNKLNMKRWLRLGAMEENRGYTINSARKATTRFGVRIELELDDKYRLTLPERYNSLPKKGLKELNRGQHQLMNCGRIGDRCFDLRIAQSNVVEVKVLVPGPVKRTKAKTIEEYFNKLNMKRWLNLDAMETNRGYIINSARKVITQYGVQIELVLDDKYRLTLPTRYSSLSKKMVKELNRGQHRLVNNGRIGDRSFDLSIAKNNVVEVKVPMPDIKQ